ncbi:hypothetical protein NQD34_017739 [Periophthalmus magnuspinnatus]|nr:hypothetical protein NQD34_017739 [Periophthalmus magnuspinnatus]
MGCSPSKGKLFSKPDNGSTLENAPLEETAQHRVNAGPAEKDKVEESMPLPLSKEYAPNQDCQIVVVDSKNNIKENEMDVMVPETITEVQESDEAKGTQRRSRNKKKQRFNGKLRKSSIIKVDFSPHMVRAHQAAYNFLNPNISKFESLLELLDQAAQTQLSLQPMMSALILRFEEINQALEEMAEEGELMLKEHGDYIPLPSGMMGPAIISALKSSNDKDCQLDPPPDLLQQLLRHSTEKMRHVGGSFQTVGDTTLEDAVEYFTSLSKALGGKMKAKHNAEQRIALVLAQVEAAAMGKSNPEDSALHSEDSGIGGENDSLTGSDRQRRHRGSAGSGSSTLGVNVRAILPSNSTNEHNEEEEEEDDIDEENDDILVRKRSNSSPPDPSQPFLNMLRMQINGHRPQTATVNESSVMRKPLAGHEINLDLTGVRRHSITGAGSNKRLSKTNPIFALQHSKPPSVRRLINSFSNPSNNIRTTSKRLSNTPAESSQVWTDSREDPDEDILPPPPPEVLMDNSFQITEGITGNEKEYHNCGLSSINKKQGLPSRLKTSVELLPNRASIKPKLINDSSGDLVRQEEGQRQRAALDPDSSLYQQAHAIIHIRSAAGNLQPPLRRDRPDAHEGDASFSLPVIAPPVSRVRLPPSCPPVRHRYPSPPVRPQSSTSRPASPKTIIRATDNPVEQIIPSVSFKDARSVFCQNERAPPYWSSCGVSVLPKPWVEGPRGQTGTRTTDSSRRTQSEHRPTISNRLDGIKHDQSLAATGQ